MPTAINPSVKSLDPPAIGSGSVLKIMRIPAASNTRPKKMLRDLGAETIHQRSAHYRTDDPADPNEHSKPQIHLAGQGEDHRPCGRYREDAGQRRRVSTMTVQANRHQQGDHDDSATNPESSGEETRGKADQDELPARYCRSLDHRGQIRGGRLRVLLPSP